MQNIGRITYLPLNEVWKHEAKDFTTWLEKNPEVLNDLLDKKMEIIEREKSAGSFSVDLVAREGERTIVIENQLYKSDHTHLGQVVTYLTSLDAEEAIWIVGDPRPEHVKAISWLNESTSASFYLIKFEAISIGDSLPAPLLTLITGPSEEAKSAGATKQKLIELQMRQRSFWQGLLRVAHSRTDLHRTISPTMDSWIGTSPEDFPSGVTLNYAIVNSAARVELYIDVGEGAGEARADRNHEIYEGIFAQKDEIEKAFGDKLIWQPLEGKYACRIKWETNRGGLADESTWPDLQDELVDAMIRFHKALKGKVCRGLLARHLAMRILVSVLMIRYFFDLDGSRRTHKFGLVPRRKQKWH
ncbi:MAG: DUF4268 domain-containing protein [Planctomycetota bacterium]|nr:DUF4268 domain-containing protein [Planctomycetota bacterium]